MNRKFRTALMLLAIGFWPILSTVNAQQPNPDSPRYKAVVALSDFLTSTGDEPLENFVKQRVAPQLRDSLGRDRLARELDKLRSDFSGAQMSGARPEGPNGAFIRFSHEQSISFEMEADPPHRFTRIGSIGGGEPSGSAVGCAPPAQQSGSSSFTNLDEKLRAEAAAETFSGVVLVAKDGEPIFHEAYGFADKSAGEAKHKDTKFNLGSINKLFTMVAVYQLFEAGKLNPDDTIGKYLPQFPRTVANSVTVKHLLEHRSGWGAYWDNPIWNARRADLSSLDDYMDFIKDIPLDFEPGSRMQYSNTGYEVLGAIIERASGQSYYDYVRDNIYQPAGMKNTDAYERGGDTPNMAIGYIDGGYDTDNLSRLSPKGTAAGGGMSTAADMLRFANALDEGTLIPSKYANRLRYGGFAGGGPGVNAMLEMNITGGHTIIVLSNFDPPTAGRVAQEISGMLRINVARKSGVEQYRIGVGFAPHDDGIAVNLLSPDAPGERGGLQPNDVILAINGVSIADDPIGQLDAVLTTPDPINLKVRRGNALKFITIVPELVDGPDSRSSSTPVQQSSPTVPGANSALATAAGCCAPPSSSIADTSVESLRDPSARVVPIDFSLQPVIDRFNADQDKPRIVALLSPTCAGCIHGARAILQEALNAYPDEELSVLIVWEAMLGSDNEAAAQESALMFADPRVHQYWDPYRRSGIAFSTKLFPQRNRQILEALPDDNFLKTHFQKLAGEPPEQTPMWDFALFYPPGVEWAGDAPPASAQWVRQIAVFMTPDGFRSVTIAVDDFTQPPIESDWFDEVKREMQILMAKE